MKNELVNEVISVWPVLVRFFLTFVPIVISSIALILTYRERRPGLTLKARKGDCYKLRATMNQREYIFQGIIEVYNVSASANAIREYRFWQKGELGKWCAIESEMHTEKYRDSVDAANGGRIFNPTPFTLAPYSGAELRVQALVKGARPYEASFRIQVEDLFGRHYQAEVRAIA